MQVSWLFGLSGRIPFIFPVQNLSEHSASKFNWRSPCWRFFFLLWHVGAFKWKLTGNMFSHLQFPKSVWLLMRLVFAYLEVCHLIILLFYYLKKIVFSYCISYVACEPSLTCITVMLQNINKCKNNWMNKQMFAHIQTLPCDCTCTQVPVLVMRKGGVNWFSSTSSITQKLVKVTEPGLQYGGFVFLSSLTLWNSWTDPALQFLG